MAQALFTGATGLRAFQRQLDVVANNLANLNTTGFKASRVQFSDLVYRNLRHAAGANGDDFGGVNPAQVGTGVQVSQISRNFSQGALQETGETLDFAIRGEGFFVLNDQTGNPVYSRAGSFSLDNQNNLVDPATGYLVQRTGTAGEQSGEDFGFQQIGESRINIPFGSVIPGVETTFVQFNGNLPSSASPPLAEVLTTINPFETTSGPATLSTTFSDLTSNVSDYVAGDLIEVVGTDIDGLPFNFTLPADTATLGDLVNSINAQISDATASLSNQGQLSITADQTGEAFLSLVIRDAATNANLTDFENHAAIIQTEGGSGDVFESATEVFDAQGNPQNVVFTFRKSAADQWEVTAGVSGGSGTIINPRTYTASFNDNGTFSFSTASSGDVSLDLQFNSVNTPQNIVLQFNRLSHSAIEFGLAQNQDGAPPGVLANIAVAGDGMIMGIGSNGSQVEIAQLAIGSFSNVDGLEAIGDNYFLETSGSGIAQIGTGQAGARGTVIGAQLEAANVDITQEFAQLIVAQRAFSANARTITVAEEILDELTSLVR